MERVVCERHGNICFLKTGVKEGPNKGKSFYVCTGRDTRPCDFTQATELPPSHCLRHEDALVELQTLIHNTTPGSYRLLYRCVVGKKAGQKWCGSVPWTEKGTKTNLLSLNEKQPSSLPPVRNPFKAPGKSDQSSEWKKLQEADTAKAEVKISERSVESARKCNGDEIQKKKTERESDSQRNSKEGEEMSSARSEPWRDKKLPPGMKVKKRSSDKDKKLHSSSEVTVKGAEDTEGSYSSSKCERVNKQQNKKETKSQNEERAAPQQNPKQKPEVHGHDLTSRKTSTSNTDTQPGNIPKNTPEKESQASPGSTLDGVPASPKPVIKNAQKKTVRSPFGDWSDDDDDDVQLVSVQPGSQQTPFPAAPLQKTLTSYPGFQLTSKDKSQEDDPKALHNQLTAQLKQKKSNAHMNSTPLTLQQNKEQETMYKMPRRESKIHPMMVEKQQLKNIEFNTLMSQINKRCSFSSWIKANIKKKECCFYVEGGRKEICMCGYPKPDHIDEAIKPEDCIGQHYDKHRHIREVPTDAFGDINFGGIGQKTGRYVRVSSDTPVEKLYQLMTDYWKLQPPNLLISVTGGAKNFDIKTDLKNKFRRGLIKVAQTTGAWILTGGTNTGVMKHVGRAVRDYNLSSNTVGGQIVAIGVATWGIIQNRQALVHPEGRFPAHYYLDEHCQAHLSCLDVNHSHFLLVDDGTSGKYGAEIELRGRLEKLISDQPLEKPESELKIPVVCVVLGGGPGTLNTIYSSMMNSSPCVVLEGSGRLADVLANVAGLPLSKITIALIQRLMKKFFAEEYKNFSELNMVEWTKKIQDIVQFPQLLTVFCIDEEKNNDVDVAILQAFLKAPRCSDSVNRERQLQLAVAWNRVDIAESEIFTEESKWKSCDLHQAMFSALVGHKAEFVRLLLENGLCIIQFLKDEKTLCDLYKHLPSCLFSRKLAKRAQGSKMITLSHVAAEVQRLLGSFTRPLYHIVPPLHKKEIASDYKDFSTTPKNQDEELACSGKERDPDIVCDAARDLFLWSVLQNQKDLAQIIWEQCNDCIAAALSASKILKKLAQKGGDTGEEAGSMRELADHYEKQAIGVFSECHRYDKHRAEKLLTRVSPLWGSTTNLCVALEAHDKSFIAHPGVQAFLTQIWCGELAVENPQWKLLLSMFFFPLIYTGFLVYRHDEVIRKEAERTEEEKLVMDSMTGMSRNDRNRHDFRNQSDASSVHPLNCWTRLVGLYTCPQVKFYWNILFYFGFLFLFALVLITDFQPTPSWKELLLYVWLASLMFEEVRQLFYDFNGFTLWKKINMYIKDSWNILDMLSILLFITGLVCRLQASSTVLYVGKIILCIDFIIFSLRLMAIFTISKILGPKIIIVRNMMMDMFFFLFLLSIWVVAYGVATQSILIENEDRINWIIRGAVYEPYLIIFGNMPDSVDNTKFDINSCSINGSDPLKPKCPVLNSDNIPVFPDWLTIIMLCVYLLFANILLLNLLIAIFNYTFQEVQDNTDIIWKFQRYELIKEYHSRPSLPPPLILLSHIYLFIRRVLLRRTPQKHKIFRQELDQTEDEELMSWESFMKENYLASLQQDSSQSMEHRMEITAEKVGTISEIIEQGQEWGSVSKRLGLLEEQVCQSAKALQWIMDTLKSQGHQSKQDAPIMASVAITNTDPSESTEQEAEWEKTHHVYARQFHYPGSNVKRFPVPLEKVPWEVDFSIYDPAIYNQENMHVSDILTLDTYRNPKGRTGLKGQGAHKNLGPNEIMYPVITRFEGSQLEFMAVWDETERCWTFPGGPVQPGELLPERLETALGKNLSQKIKAKIKSGSHTEVCKGYVDDSRNTDNAWVESTVITVHLEDEWRLMMRGGDGESRSSTEKLEWQEVSGKTPMNTYQREALCTIAQKHNIKF